MLILCIEKRTKLAELDWKVGRSCFNITTDLWGRQWLGFREDTVYVYWPNTALATRGVKMNRNGLSPKDFKA